MSAILKQATAAARQVSHVRTFCSTIVARKGQLLSVHGKDPIPNMPVDPVQGLYIRALQGYQPPSMAKDAHVGVVKQFSLPPSPQPPTVTANLSSQLDAYDAAEPTSAPVSTSSTNSQEDAGGADEFLTFLEADVPKPDHGHH